LGLKRGERDVRAGLSESLSSQKASTMEKVKPKEEEEWAESLEGATNLLDGFFVPLEPTNMPHHFSP